MSLFHEIMVACE